MRKYGDPGWKRPEAFFPRLGDITVYAMTIARLSGKEQALPEVSQRWPALDRTRTPQAIPPAPDGRRNEANRMNDMTSYLPGIVLAYSVFFLAIVSPGPNILAVIGTSMGAGRRSGLALALGVAAGSFCWALLTVIGLSALIASYAVALKAIKIGGGLYLLWLGFKSFRSAASAQDLEASLRAGTARSPMEHATRGFTVQMTNPKAALAWIAIMSLGLQDGAPWWVGASLVAGTSGLSVLIHCLYAVAFSTRVVVRVYAKAGYPASTVLSYAKNALSRMGALVGTYPYPSFKVAQSAGGYGMESPQLIRIPGGDSGTHLRWLVHHETAHQWFYGIVGNDQARQPFDDEAAADQMARYVTGIWQPSRCATNRLDLSIYGYSATCYFHVIYIQGSSLLDRVRQRMGTTAYWRAMRDYVAAHRYGIATTKSLLDTLDAHTSLDLRSMFASRFPSIY